MLSQPLPRCKPNAAALAQIRPFYRHHQFVFAKRSYCDHPGDLSKNFSFPGVRRKLNRVTSHSPQSLTQPVKLHRLIRSSRFAGLCLQILPGG
ncbi:hypothetical protein SAMN05421753_105115 [Planctomicrobium piriforme]|uniref:Uncharacterized protein n=1 Tax=Planctomicrobium piriforme TaxID=1576369 RepID=A0A1I3F7L1_9PLAN|nr:hypothetical protein SAMN05421753_105115 [Planctomicrobium piriforme]